MTKTSGFRGGSLPRRALGFVLLLFFCTPVFLLLDHAGTGVPGAQAVQLSRSFLQSTLWGGAAAMGGGLVLAILLPSDPLRRGLRRIAAYLRALDPWPFALVAGLVSGGAAVLVSRAVFAGLPTLEDGMAMLVHARFSASGLPAGQLPEPRAAWLIPNTLLTDEGWISQYPPLHILLLAGGHALGMPWLLGPALVAATVIFTARIAELALGARSATARMGAILSALSPFLLFLGAGYLSHSSAAAFGAVAIWAALRALKDDRARWPGITGAAAGAIVATRPWTGLFLGVILPAGLWTVQWIRDRGSTRLYLRRLGFAALGGLPAAVALALYNLRYFGSPLRFGYTAGYGNAHLPGFHRDPWGQLYGVREALGYTSADLLALGTHLFESPVPVLLVVALAVLLVNRLRRGTGILLAWGLLPVAANALYWHHGYHFGPRMLYEAAPAWCLLVVVASVALVASPASMTRGGPAAITVPRSDEDQKRTDGPAIRVLVRDGLLWALVLSAPVAGYLSVERSLGYRWSPETLQRMTPPRPPGGQPSLVFVHGSWPERVAGRLRASGLGADSVETAFRRNDLCTVHRYAAWRAERDASATSPPELDFRNQAGSLKDLEVLEAPGGYVIRRDPSRVWSTACLRELTADRRGVISLAPLLWQGDLPGVEEGEPLFVRDLGPAENAALLARWPDRRTWVWVASPGESRPRMWPYEEAMDVLW